VLATNPAKSPTTPPPQARMESDLKNAFVLKKLWIFSKLLKDLDFSPGGIS